MDGSTSLLLTRQDTLTGYADLSLSLVSMTHQYDSSRIEKDTLTGYADPPK